MKKLFLVVIALLMVNSLSAQEWQKNIFGVRAGLNVSSFSTSYDEDLDVRTAFHVGFNYERLLAKNLPLYLETGLQLSAKGTQYNDFGEAQYTCDQAKGMMRRQVTSMPVVIRSQTRTGKLRQL